MHTADPFNSFWAFVCERDEIWTRREIDGRHEPWTSDPILRDYHFTNVHRHKDTGTRWIMRYLEEEPDSSDLVFMFAAYRMLNSVSTTEAFGVPEPDHDSVLRWNLDLLQARAEGRNLGSKRHQTSLSRTVGALHYMIDHPSGAERVWDAADGVEMAKVLSGVPGIGSFFAVQIAADVLTFPSKTRRAPRDAMVSLATGSRTAARVLLYRDDVVDLSVASDMNRERRNIARIIGLDDDELWMMLQLSPPKQPSWLSEPLTPVDIEHSLCEWKRYTRLQSGDDAWAAPHGMRRTSARA